MDKAEFSPCKNVLWQTTLENYIIKQYPLFYNNCIVCWSICLCHHWPVRCCFPLSINKKFNLMGSLVHTNNTLWGDTFSFIDKSTSGVFLPDTKWWAVFMSALHFNISCSQSPSTQWMNSQVKMIKETNFSQCLLLKKHLRTGNKCSSAVNSVKTLSHISPADSSTPLVQLSKLPINWTFIATPYQETGTRRGTSSSRQLFSFTIAWYNFQLVKSSIIPCYIRLTITVNSLGSTLGIMSHDCSEHTAPFDKCCSRNYYYTTRNIILVFCGQIFHTFPCVLILHSGMAWNPSQTTVLITWNFSD